MTLQELLRGHASEALRGLDTCQNRLRELGSQRRAEVTQLGTLQADIESHRRESTERRRLLEGTAEALRNIEKKIEELQREFDRIAEQREELNQAVIHSDEDVQGGLERRKKIAGRVDALDHQMRELVLEKERFEHRVQSARRAALLSYLEDLEKRLAQRILIQETLTEKVDARRRLEEARHNNVEIMNLYEARAEVQKLLTISNVSTVRDRLRQQLQDLESQLERLFPGALAVEHQPQDISEIEEIFFTADDAGRSHVFLPISPRRWKAIGDGDLDAPAVGSLRLVWALAKGLGVTELNA